MYLIEVIDLQKIHSLLRWSDFKGFRHWFVQPEPYKKIIDLSNEEKGFGRFAPLEKQNDNNDLFRVPHLSSTIITKKIHTCLYITEWIPLTPSVDIINKIMKNIWRVGTWFGSNWYLSTARLGRHSQIIAALTLINITNKKSSGDLSNLRRCLRTWI